jgi:hypothetical protein
MAEIAERLIEVYDISPLYLFSFLRRMGDLATNHRRMIPSVLYSMSGNSLAVVESFSVQAEPRGLTKQAIHVEWHNELAALRVIYPEIADLLKNMRDRADNHEVGRQADAMAHGWRKGGAEEVDDAGQE